MPEAYTIQPDQPVVVYNPHVLVAIPLIFFAFLICLVLAVLINVKDKPGE